MRRLTKQERSQLYQWILEAKTTYGWDAPFSDPSEIVGEGEPEWAYSPAISPLFKVGIKVRHPTGGHAEVFAAGTCLFGNLYRLRIFNDEITSDPDWWYSDWSEEDLVVCQGRNK